MVHDLIRKRQSEVQKSGAAWEDFVMDFCNRELQGKGIRVIKGKEINDNRTRYSKIWNILSIPVKNGKVWGDIDLVAVDNDQRPITVISCKTSLHGRFTETLFYSLLFRQLNGIKVVLATPDKGRQQRSGVWQSEWGSQERPTKDRQLAEQYLDGVYIYNERTRLGGIVNSLEELPNDILKWSGDK